MTHANDMSQRYVPLRVERRSGGAVRLTAPPDAAVAGPGYYMLFLVSDRGVPSVAEVPPARAGRLHRRPA